MLMHSMQQRNKELAAKFNLLQPDLTHLWENYTSHLYDKTEVNQDITITISGSNNNKVLFRKEWRKLDKTNTERKNIFNSLENKLQGM